MLVDDACTFQSSIIGILDALCFFFWQHNCWSWSFASTEGSRDSERKSKGPLILVSSALWLQLHDIFFSFLFFIIRRKLFLYWVLLGKVNASQFDSGKCSVVHLETNHSSQTQQLSLNSFFCFLAIAFTFAILQCQLIYLPVSHTSETTK